MKKPTFQDIAKPGKPDGKKAKAPCGHDGTHISPNVVICDRGCDAVPKAVDREITERFTTKPFCPHLTPYIDTFLGQTFCYDCGAKIDV